MVGFVNDQVAVLGDDHVAGSNVRQQQRVVDDDNVGFGGALPRDVQRAAGLTARIPIADIIFGVEAAPGYLFLARAQCDLVHVARVGLGQPVENAGIERHFVRVVGATMAHLLKEAGAQIVALAFQNGGPQLKEEHFLQLGNVFENELVLQVNGIGGDDHGAVVGIRPESGRQ